MDGERPSKCARCHRLLPENLSRQARQYHTHQRCKPVPESASPSIQTGASSSHDGGVDQTGPNHGHGTPSVGHDPQDYDYPMGDQNPFDDEQSDGGTPSEEMPTPAFVDDAAGSPPGDLEVEEMVEEQELEDYLADGTESELSSIAPSDFEYISDDDHYVFEAEAEGLPENDARRGTYGFYQLRLNEPICDGSPLTLLQFMYAFLSWIHTNKLSSKSAQEQLDLWTMGLPQNHIVPPTIYLLKRLANIGDLDAFDHHVCPCEQHRYDHIPRSAWESHANECCPKQGCGQPRFKRLPTGRLEPQQRFYFLGVERAIQQQFRTPGFAEARGKGRCYEDPANWFGSPHALWVNQVTGGTATTAADIPKHPGEAFRPENSVYCLGLDWLQVFKSRNHSLCLITMRCEDLEPVYRAKKDAVFPVAIIPGPKEPKHMDIYLELICKEFLSASKAGVKVRPLPITHTAADGTVSETASPEFVHKGFLVSIYADAPARQKCGSYIQGFQAYLPCHWCWMTSVRVPGQGGRTVGRQMGYLEPVTAERGLKFGKEMQIGVNDAARKLTHRDQELRALRVEKARLAAVDPENDENYKSTVSFEGVTGNSVLFSMLPTLHRNDAFMLPMYHTFILGPVKKFLVLMWHGDKSQAGVKDFLLQHKAKILAMEKNFMLTSDFGRPYESLRLCKMYIIEQAERFLEVFSCFLFNPEVVGFQALTPKAMKAWGHLRRSVLHHLRDSPGCYEATRRQQARADFLEFSKMCEKDLHALCTINTHIINCRAPDQEERCGRLNKCNELFVERSLQEVKDRTYHQNPEHTLTKQLLVGSVLAGMRSEHPGLMSAAEYKASGRTRETGPNYDDPTGKEGLMFAGRAPTTEELALIVQRLKINPADFDIWVHGAAFIGHVEQLRSTSYSREQSRRSYFIKVRYQEGDEELVYVAVVKFYVRLCPKEVAEGGVHQNTIDNDEWPAGVMKRYAFCDIYKRQEELKNADTGDLFWVKHFEGDPDRTFNANEQGYQIPLENIDTKLVGFATKREEDPENCFRYYFTVCQATSGHVF